MAANQVSFVCEQKIISNNNPRTYCCTVDHQYHVDVIVVSVKIETVNFKIVSRGRFPDKGNLMDMRACIGH